LVDPALASVEAIKADCAETRAIDSFREEIDEEEEYEMDLTNPLDVTPVCELSLP